MDERLELTSMKARLTQMEEAIAFGSHETDQLKEHFLALTRAVESLERRVAFLEESMRDSRPERVDPASGEGHQF